MFKSQSTALPRPRMAATLGILATVLFAGVSDAGLKGTNQIVIINTTSRTVTGALGLARNSSNNVEYIGCGRDSAGTVTCTAKNAAGTTASCSTTTAALRDVLNSMNGDSFLQFTYNTSGGCTAIYVDNYSMWPQKL